MLDERGGAILVASAGELAEALSRLLADESATRRLDAAAERAIAPLSGALGRTWSALQPYLRREGQGAGVQSR